MQSKSKITLSLSSLLVSSRSDAASSSGYESMRNDTSHASSDSCSEKGLSRGKRKGKNQYKYSSIHAILQFAQSVHLSLSKVPYLVGGYGRSRSASPGSSSRKYSPKRWFSRKSLEPVQIKVYEVDDMERVQKAMVPIFQVQTEVFISSSVLLQVSGWFVRLFIHTNILPVSLSVCQIDSLTV